MSGLPYRLNVGAALFNRDGLVFIGRRADQPGRAAHVWQMPQGGIDAGEDPRTAVFRELQEETGTGERRNTGRACGMAGLRFAAGFGGQVVWRALPWAAAALVRTAVFGWG